jgi:gliding motility-associated-like protein
MARNLPLSLLFSFLFFTISLKAVPAVLEPGDIAVVSVSTDMGPCGLHADDDQISFVCFKDITAFTIIHITDNGWETAFPGFWGNTEGTLQLQRAGGTIPAGTVITLTVTNNAGNYVYAISSPDNAWFITEVNLPDKPFNLEQGGDQVFFLQGGVWTHGALNMATYSGQVIYGYTTAPSWTANGTTHQSNLPADVDPCFNMSSGGADYYKYNGDFSVTNQFDWWHRFQNSGLWTAPPDCISFAATFPNYPAGFSIGINTPTLGVTCHGCTNCPTYSAFFTFDLPPGYFFDVQYTDGTDTFSLFHVQNGDAVNVTISDTTTYTLISVVEPGGCPVNYPFTNEATFNAPHNNAGTHGTLFICPDYGVINLGIFLGPHDPGGQWFPPLDPFTGMYYSSNWGPGVYHYVFVHPPCPIDSASVSVYWVDTAGTHIDIGCDDNGTPFDITDDRMKLTVYFTVNAPDFGLLYEVIPGHYNVPYGTITPQSGVVGDTTVFLLSPGTATLTNMSLLIRGYIPLICDWRIPLPPPGFCSDPCDHSMTAEISGGGDICPNNCPGSPVEFEIDHDGGLEDFTADFTVTAPGFPVWTFTDIPLEGFAPTLFTVCVDDIPAPIFDAGSNSFTFPKTLAGQDVTIKLLGVYDFYHCAGTMTNDEITVSIHALPPISTTSFKVCKGVSTTVDLTMYDQNISHTYDVHWFDENPYDGGNEIFNPNVTNLQNVVSLWAYVEDDYCGNSIQVPFMILPQPDLDSVPPLQVCNGDALLFSSIALNDAGNSMATYTFHDSLPPDTSNQFDNPFFFPVDTTTIYVLATAGMCYDTLPIEVDLQHYPDFLLQGLPCNLINNTYTIVFTSSADSIHASKGIVVNNLMGQDSVKGIPADSSVIIEILNPSGLCKDTFLIVAPNCNCPFIPQPIASQSSYSICEGQPNPTLSVTVNAGLQVNWYDVPSGGVPLLQNSLNFQPVPNTSATYYAEALDPTNLCYSIRTDIPVSVNPVAQLQMLPDEVLCETETLNFNTMTPNVLNGVAGSGQWYNLATHQQVVGTIAPQNGDAWYYLFTTSAGFCNTSDTIQATVNPLPTLNVYDIVCDDVALTFDIFFVSTADVVLVNAGTLTQVAGTDSFSLTDIPYNTNIQFDLSILATGCTATVNQLAPNCLCPALLQSNSDHLCSNSANVDLATYVNPGVNGTWQMVSTPPGGNPATLAGSNFQGVGKDPGLYTLRFIRNIILANCIDTAVFQLTLSTSPFVDAGTNGTSCAPDVIQLNGSASGSNVQFTWTENGTGSLTNANSLSPTYTPTLADITAGSVKFTLTATDQTGFCPSATETITVTIDGSAYYIVNPTSATYCDTANIDVDFDDLISFGTKGGHWFFPAGVNAPITNNSHFNPTTLTPGNYTVYYTTSNAVLPCKNDTAAVSLTIRNCMCPSVALSNPVNALCSEADVQNLTAFLITGEAGTWSIVGKPAGVKPAVINGTNFVTNNSDAGNYTLRYTLSNPVSGCPDSAEISLTVIATPTIQFSSVKCADDLQSWEVIITSTAQSVTGNLGTMTSLGNSKYQVTGIALLTNLQVTASNGNGLCTSTKIITAPDCACTLSISNLPSSVSLCPEDKITLQPTVSGAKGTATSFWIVANDTLFQTNLEVSQAGSYNFVSMDSLGCQVEQAVDVTVYQEMDPDVSVSDVNCPGDHDGVILLNAIMGGNGPFFISLNGSNSQPILSFPYRIDNLAAGNYKIELTDAFSCSISLNVVVNAASSESLSLGPDKTILVGDSVLIAPVLSFVPDTFYWTGDVSLLDPNKLDNWIKPEVDQNISLFAIDAKGCLYSDDLFIKVLLNSSIYVPTVFSPNDDGVNDFIGPKGDPSVITFQFFEIFSRWGELVYSVKDFTSADNKGWDGKLDGKPMQPGVFVYQVSATNKKGKVITKYGDFTLIR